MSEPGRDKAKTLRERLALLREALVPLQQEQQDLVEAARRLEARAVESGDPPVVRATQRAAERLRAAGGALAQAQRILVGAGEEAAAAEQPAGPRGEPPANTT